MAHFSIKDLEQLSGIKAHTIRIWEQRYKLLQPDRNTANVRSYDRTGLITLLQVAVLNESGIKISKITGLSQAEVTEQIAQLSFTTATPEVWVTALVLGTLHYDEAGFEKISEQTVKSIGFEHAMLQLIFPFLERIGHEKPEAPLTRAYSNFARNLIVRCLQLEIDRLPLPGPNHSARFLLFLPEGSHDEVSLLFMHYLLRVRQIPALYLGGGISLEELRETAEIFRAGYLATFVTRFSNAESANHPAEALAARFPDKVIYVCGNNPTLSQQTPGTSVKFLADVSVFIRELAIL